jgi:hypothetical protein
MDRRRDSGGQVEQREQTTGDDVRALLLAADFTDLVGESWWESVFGERGGRRTVRPVQR